MPPKTRRTTPISVDADVTLDSPSTPMGLPEGTVRAALALIVILVSWVGSLLLLALGDLDFDQAMAIIGLSGFVTGYYFGARK